MSNKITKCFFHVDLDAFFASVEQIENPSLVGKPVIIGGNPFHRRTVVSTASYEARKYGVHSAMPSAKAYSLCPNGIFIEPNMKLYSKYSYQVMNILKNYSPDFLQLSIDEACLDMTGTQRLFGSPTEIAYKIKKEVKEKTGLTISIGIATNSYLAKICSDINKPDGLYEITPGNEENFMNTLPLKKVWGIGEKTLNRLHTIGLNSVKDIKSHSIEFFKSIFGESTATFLYNVSRGKEPENFHSKPKSHSISNETTFEFDLTDRNIIEKNILYLCSELMERLLKENLTSLTVQLKIRYEDFSTVNIQQTFETPILCSDELFERAMMLFDKKYEFNRGIRLLGIGLQKVTSTNNLIQPELFETQNKKKQSVEKAILDLKTKNPKINIQRATFIDKTKIILFTLFASTLLNLNSQIFAKEQPTRPKTSTTTLQNAGTITEDTKLPPQNFSNGITLYNHQFANNTIELIAEGYWNVNLKQNSTATFGYDNELTFDFGMPIFEQEVDLSVWFLLNNKWFLEGAFADKFNKNSFTFGYKGNKTLKEAKISNRNIIFPDKYSLSNIGKAIGGGDNQAPGISVSLSDANWELDAAVRYDMLTSFDKVYYGNNSVNNLKIQKEDFIDGLIFILPSKEICKEIESIYIEHPNGNFIDEANRKYKQISKNDYLIIANKNQVILSSDISAKKSNNTKPCVLIEFSSDAKLLLEDELGIFGTSNNPGTNYLGKIQEFFGSKINYGSINNKPNVSSFSYGNKIQNISSPDTSGTKIDGFFTTLNNKKMLLAQNSVGFSPFVAAFRYYGGKTQVKDVYIASYSSEIKNNNYNAIVSDSSELIKNNYFDSNSIYIDVYNSNFSINSTDQNGNIINYTSPQINFPFADFSPGTYLGFNSTNDDCILLKTYFQSTRIDIGSNAVPGTIQVYKNGILDNNATYNPNSGEIKLSTAINETDKIYITWCEETSDKQTGMISGAIGFKYNFLENLFGDIALATKWSLSPELNYAEENRSSNGYATLSSKIQWKEEKISLSNTIGTTIQLDNATGIYKISGMDESKPTTAYLASNAANNLPTNFVPCLNGRSFILNSTDELINKNNCSLPRQTGSLDKDISGYKVPINYNFDIDTQNSTNKILWAANSIYMPANKYNLSKSSKFSVAIKLSEKFIQLANLSDSKTKIYLQLGVDSSSDFNFENKGNIPTWKIFDSSYDTNSNYIDIENPLSAENTQWQTVTVLLNDLDRANFTENYNARIIITTSKTPEEFYQNGTIFIGPYEHIKQGIFTAQEKIFKINTEQQKQLNVDTKKFNKDTNYSENISWKINNFDSNTIINDPNIISYKYFENIDLSSYKTINLYFAYNVSGKSKEPTTMITTNDIGITLTLDDNSKDAYTDGKKALEVKIPIDELKQFIEYNEIIVGQTQNLHKLEINRITKEIFIDGIKLKNTHAIFNSKINPNRLKIKFNSIVKTQNSDESLIYEKGKFTIDDFFLSDNCPKVILQNQFNANLLHNNEILKIKDFTLLKDASLFLTSDIINTIPTESTFANKTDISANAIGNITLASIKIQNQIGRSPDSKNLITSASHSISTTTPILNILSINENFTTNNDEKFSSKETNATINLSKIKIPLQFKTVSSINIDQWTKTQNLNEQIDFTTGKKIKYNLSILANASQKTLIQELGDDTFSKNYFTNWFDSTKYQFSKGDPNAQKRNISATIKNTFSFPFLSFSPQINFSQIGNYTSTSQNYFSELSDFSIVLPIRFNNMNLSFNYSKSSTSIQNVSKGGDYFSDLENTINLLQNKKWYFTALPFYDLFSRKLAKNVFNSFDTNKNPSTALNEIEESINYNANYELTWKRQLSATKNDLFIPTIASLAFTRDIACAENLTDNYQGKLSVGFTAIDIFCKNGSVPIFNWCKADEYNLSFQSSLKFPRNDLKNAKQLYSTYAQANFYKNDFDILQTALQFTFQDKTNWSGKMTLLYKRESETTPILSIIKLFNKKINTNDIKISRTNSLNFNTYSSQGTLTTSKQISYQSIEISHLLELMIKKEVSINGSISGIFTHTKNQSCSLGYELGIGAKLNF